MEESLRVHLIVRNRVCVLNAAGTSPEFRQEPISPDVQLLVQTGNTVQYLHL